MEKLPREIINKIFFFISHPVADIFNLELEVALARFARDIEIDEYCDCCECLWTECECICANCHDNYSTCRYGCYDSYRIISYQS